MIKKIGIHFAAIFFFFLLFCFPASAATATVTAAEAQALGAAWEQMLDNITATGRGITRLEKIGDLVSFDFIEYLLAINLGKDFGGTKFTVTVYPDHFIIDSGDVDVNLRKENEDAMVYIRSMTDGLGPDLESVKKLFGTIAERFVYKTHDDGHQSVLRMFEEGAGNCGDFAKTWKACLDTLGIENEYVCGKVLLEDGYRNHAWNTFTLDGICYAVDVTGAVLYPERMWDYFKVTDDRLISDRYQVSFTR